MKPGVFGPPRGSRIRGAKYCRRLHLPGVQRRTRRLRIDRVYDAIDLLKSPDFFVGVHVNHAGSQDLKAGPLRSWLQTKLGELDSDEVANVAEIPGISPDWPGWDDDIGE